MRTVFVLFDSLSRRALECYGGSLHTPNFKRFSDRAVTFDNHYVGSLPCMPARRDMHTGRLNFMHRSWGPLEPFDVSFSEILREQNIYTHLITDHYHYLEEGGLNYQNRYKTWELERGQEWDPWRALVDPPMKHFEESYHPLQHEFAESRCGRAQCMVNRAFVKSEDKYAMPRCFKRAEEFLDNNRNAEDWFLQIECYDPHEPFAAPSHYRSRYPTAYEGPILDWPRYRRVEESADEIAEIRANYAALVTMCDAYFGKLLDYFDEHELWHDTALIVTTDHGYLLSEHDWWAKSRMPFYNEIAHIPLVIHYPGLEDKAGQRRQSLTQNIDLTPTFLGLYGVEVPEQVTGHSLVPVLADDTPARSAAIYGQFGAAINITDGRYTYFRYPEDVLNQELFEYTLMPTHQWAMFAREEFEGVTLIEDGFSFTRGFPVLKLPARPHPNRGQGSVIEDTCTVMFDLLHDPGQERPIHDPTVERHLIEEMRQIMARNEAPPEAFTRLTIDECGLESL